MIRAVNQSNFRSNMKQLCDEVCDGTTLFVTRKHGKKLVIISEEDYNELIGYKNKMEDI